MTAKVAALRRHPIKSHGCEALEQVTLEPDACLPWDRRWAVTHEAARIDGSGWAPCANFSRGAKAPSLMAISCTSNVATGYVTLRHPDRPDLTLDPDIEGDRLIEWVRPLMPRSRASSKRVIRVPGRGMTDSDWPSVSILNRASHADVEHILNVEMSMDRWRGNIWIEGPDAWSEKTWVGRVVCIGSATLRVREEITRCLATTANPKTGKRDIDTLGALDQLGHQEFGIYAEVIEGGDIAVGASVELR